MLCNSCQADNLADAKVCMDCGAALAPTAGTPAANIAVTNPSQTVSNWQSLSAPDTFLQTMPLSLAAAPLPTAALPMAIPAAVIPSAPPSALTSVAAANSGSLSAAAPMSVASGSVTCVIERCGRTVFELTLTKPEALIGRADVDEHNMPVIPDLDLTDADPDRLSSRCHARLILTGDSVFIEDLGSANGTYLDGTGKLNAHQPYPLPPGARVMFGRGGPILRWHP